MTARGNITGHYAGDGEIARRIDGQLRLSGLTDNHTLSPSDVEAVDQFHVGGLEATQGLARLFSPSTRLTFWTLVPGWARNFRRNLEEERCGVV